MRSLIIAFIAVALVSMLCGAFLSRVVLCDQEVRPHFDARGRYDAYVTYCISSWPRKWPGTE